MNKLCIKMIEWYQRKTVNSKKRCKYYPSCSNYGLECYKRFNFFKASFLTFYRLIRCNPWSKGGYDPVPERKSKLVKLADTYYILEYKENTDRPNLGYILNDDTPYIIDGGNSKKHIKRFYKLLKKNHLPLPEISIITHHHWDHTFGLYYTKTKSIGLIETNKILEKHKETLDAKGIKELLKTKEIPLFCKDHIYLEYKRQLRKIKIKLLDETFAKKKDIDNLTLFKFPSNHSNDNLAILDTKTKILFLGDALCGKIIDFDFIKDVNILNEQYQVLEKLDFETVILSHQKPISKDEILEKIINDIQEKN